MFWGFNTNGLAHHAFADAVTLLAEIGYEGLALTLDHDLLERRDGDFFWRTNPEQIRDWTETHGLKTAVETGARFLLDPWRKHRPNLLDPNPNARELRRKYYFRAVELAAVLQSSCVSIWSGAAVPVSENADMESAEPAEPASALFQRLGEELQILTDFAGERGVSIAFEPEPGMFIDTMAQFERLLDCAPKELRLTLDVGHLFCQEESIPLYVQKHANRLVNIHFEDSVRGIHEHLFPGEGQIDFQEFFTALRSINYSGGVFVELSRQSAAGAETAKRAFDFLETFKSRLN